MESLVASLGYFLEEIEERRREYKPVSGNRGTHPDFRVSKYSHDCT
jgi:hypothetical protein